MTVMHYTHNNLEHLAAILLVHHHMPKVGQLRSRHTGPRTNFGGCGNELEDDTP